jgi:hypothetical protein
MPRLLPRLAPILLGAALMAPVPALAQYKAYQIQPSKLDPGVHDFDFPSVAIANGSVPNAPLALFLTGTSGKPEGNPHFLTFIADQGYPVISLAYDDEPAVAQVCPQDPDPDCSEAFRRMRIDGVADGPGKSPVQNPPAESITTRLATLLRALAQAKPNEGWDRYLDGDQPRWDRILVSGLSQGAGMAAYIAKHHQVARVVLFSSPWDSTGRDHHPAPWLSQPTATPMERWFAEYNKREKTADLIQAAYAALQIPPDHIRVFARDLPSDFHGNSPNPYHVITIIDQGYAPDWKIMFGKPQADGSIQ